MLQVVHFFCTGASASPASVDVRSANASPAQRGLPAVEGTAPSRSAALCPFTTLVPPRRRAARKGRPPARPRTKAPGLTVAERRAPPRERPETGSGHPRRRRGFRSRRPSPQSPGSLRAPRRRRARGHRRRRASRTRALDGVEVRQRSARASDPDAEPARGSPPRVVRQRGGTTRHRRIRPHLQGHPHRESPAQSARSAGWAGGGTRRLRSRRWLASAFMTARPTPTPSSTREPRRPSRPARRRRAGRRRWRRGVGSWCRR